MSDWDIVQVEDEVIWSAGHDDKSAGGWRASSYDPSDQQSLPTAANITYKWTNVPVDSYMLVHTLCGALDGIRGWVLYTSGRYQCRACKTYAPENMQVAARLAGVQKLDFDRN